MQIMKKKLLTLLFTLFLPIAMSGQVVGLKTNLIHWATVTPNLSLEVAFNNRFTGELYGAIHNFELFKDNTKWKHWMVQPEVRFWTCESFNGFFIGVHAMTGQFNMGKLNLPPIATTFKTDIYSDLPNSRYQGTFVGGGISLGYQWIISKCWNIELSLGAGYNYIWYKKFGPDKCDPQIDEGNTHYIGPTKAALTFVFFFK